MSGAELAALAEGRVLLDRCGACAASQGIGMPHCQACGADRLDRVEAAGSGRVVTFTRVRRRFAPDDPPPPYLTAVVRLDEGPRVLAVAEDAWAPLAVGDEVVLRPGHDGLAPRMSPSTSRIGGDDGGRT